MSNQPGIDPSRYPTLPTAQPTPQEEALAEWFATQRIQSIDNLEGAARQIITLCTGLLTVLLGIIALAAESWPVYMNVALLRWLSTVTVLALFVALASALLAVLPGANPVKLNDPDNLVAAYDRLLAYKHNWLQIALVAFAIAMLCLTGVIVGALWVR